MSRHRATRRHAGHLRLVGTPDYVPRHAAGVEPPVQLPAPVRSLAAVVAVRDAAPAPSLAVRPVGARPRGPRPYEIHPPTQPIAAITGAAA